jgi:tetratricopeptide (TPR) repeat protein
LGQQLNNLGEWQEGLREIQEAYGLEPNNERYTVGLMASYANLDRLDEAKAVGENAVSQKLDAGEIHRGLLYFAYLQGDRAAVEKEIQWFQGKPEEYRSLQTQAANAAVLGHRRQAEALRQQAAEAARRQNLPDAAAGLLASSLLDDALMEDCAAARGQTGGSPLIQALCGNPAAAQKLAHDPSAAPAGASTVYLQAYLQAVAGSSQRNAPDAGAGFQKILEHKGAYWGPFYAPSYVGLARAALLAGDTAKAKKAYQDFLASWKDADPDIPILIAAKKEYAALP